MAGGGGTAPTPPTVGQQLSSAINTLSSQGGQLVSAEQSVDPALNQLNINNQLQSNQALSSYYFNQQVPQAEQAYLTNQGTNAEGMAKIINSSATADLTQGMWDRTMGVSQLQSAAQPLVNAGLDKTLTGIAGSQLANTRGSSFTNTNNYVMSQLGTQSPEQMRAEGLGGFGSIASVLGLNSQSSLLGQMQGSAQRALAQPLSSTTQGLQSLANSQLALGGHTTQQEQDLVAQASRAADSARGVFHSSASNANELLNEDQFSQQRLQQREGFATNVSQEVNAENQTAQNFAANTQSAVLANKAQNQSFLQSQEANQNSLANLAQIAQQAKTSNAIGMSQLDEQLSQQNLVNAANTQGNALSQQYNRQALGIQQLQYLAGIGANQAQSVYGTVTGGSVSQNYATGVQGVNAIQANTSPGVMNSLNLFGASQNASNQAFAAQQANYQSGQNASQATTGAAIGAGGAIAGGLIAL